MTRKYSFTFWLGIIGNLGLVLLLFFGLVVLLRGIEPLRATL